MKPSSLPLPPLCPSSLTLPAPALVVREQNFHAGNMLMFLFFFSFLLSLLFFSPHSFFKRWVVCLPVSQTNDVYLKCVHSSPATWAWAPCGYSVRFSSRVALPQSGPLLVWLKRPHQTPPHSRHSRFHPKDPASFRLRLFPSVVWAGSFRESTFQRKPAAGQRLVWCGDRRFPPLNWTRCLPGTCCCNIVTWLLPSARLAEAVTKFICSSNSTPVALKFCLWGKERWP